MSNQTTFPISCQESQATTTTIPITTQTMSKTKTTTKTTAKDSATRSPATHVASANLDPSQAIAFRAVASPARMMHAAPSALAQQS